MGNTFQSRPKQTGTGSVSQKRENNTFYPLSAFLQQ